MTNSVPCYFSLKSQVFFFLSLVYSSNIEFFWEGKCISKKLLEMGFNSILHCFTMYFFPLAGLMICVF